MSTGKIPQTLTREMEIGGKSPMTLREFIDWLAEEGLDPQSSPFDAERKLYINLGGVIGHQQLMKPEIDSDGDIVFEAD